MSIFFVTAPRGAVSRLLKSTGLAALLLVCGCESKWEKMPDHELAQKASECMNMNAPGPAQIQICKNYQRECERRRKMGIYVC